MSNQLFFLFSRVIQFIKDGNFAGAELLLNQIIKYNPKNSEALRYLAFIFAKRGDYAEALKIIEKAIAADKKNEAAYSNRGDIEKSLGMYPEAISSYQKAIKCNPIYAEAFNNLGNLYQELGENKNAVECYKKSISIDSKNPEYFCNMGNALWRLDQIWEARRSYEHAISLAPEHSNSIHNLAHLDLQDFNFIEGWGRYEYRWLTGNDDQPNHLATSQPRWDGLPRNNRLFIWAEQGVGDQILYASMLKELAGYPQSLIVSADKKLLPIFSRSFPEIQFIDKDVELSEKFYDEHIPMGSLGSIFRAHISAFKNTNHPYLIANSNEFTFEFNHSINCGISWKSGRAKLGAEKSISLIELSEILEMKNINFVNLQYGEVKEEIGDVHTKLGRAIQAIEGIDLYEDIDGASTVLDACNVVITTSNTTAHIAGSLGKETLLILPCGNSRFWYWHDVDGVSLWYPSIRVFKQEKLGDWSKPIQEVKTYLENRFGS